ncbi:hypothetical protein ACP3T3_03290 [Chryseobacterium sp. CBSDS_008]|uniref:hypothetical protein n=1 Tax=Chryseobacterium sp. CBSDS_008 TaxID=3415265 RepID=UPI003CF027E4
MLHNKVLRKILLFFVIPLSVWVSAQADTGISMEIRNEHNPGNPNIIDILLVLKNNENNHFKGRIDVKTPKGFRTISDNNSEIELNAGQNLFIPIKVLTSNSIVSGKADLTFTITDEKYHQVVKKILSYAVTENNTMKITAENPVVYMGMQKDSLEVRARVSNLGNKKQHVTIVFKIPEAVQKNLFIEKKGTIDVQKDSVFIFRFLPSGNLLRSSQFTVNIAGFREPDKEIFGNASVSVQNVSSTQRYQDVEFDLFSNYSKNTITASYRRVGNATDMYQLIGSGGFNVPSGYMFIRGNIYTLNNQSDPVVSNTYVSYHREKSEFTLGNISKLMELSLFGRGAEYSYTSLDKEKKIEVGFVDQSFSLIERNSFLKYGYGFYAKGILGVQNASKNFSATYIFKKDPYEKASHNVLGTDIQYTFNQYWKMNSRIYSGLSFYENSNLTQPSMALESQYSGSIKKFNLNGNYFYSTNYYPGNRRGILQIQQNITTQIFENHYLYANIMISNFSPKFYSFNNDFKSNTTRGDIGINFAKRKNFGFAAGAQYQQENSNSYNNFFDTSGNLEIKKLEALRVIQNLTWISNNKKHSTLLALEAGSARYPDADHAQYQMKATGNYSYKWFNINGIYQYGSYYLSEFASSRNISQDITYKKFSLSAFFNKNLFGEKLTITSGLSYTDDVLYGKSPSGFVNLKYTKERYGVFLNSSWYNYSSSNFNNNFFTVEAGVTLNFQPNRLIAARKGEISAVVYYDHNNNNIYDEGDQSAENYIIMINNVSFKTNNEGKIVYKAIPFGKYMLKQVIQQGWYYNEMEFEVKKHSCFLQIPLHQNGTMLGKINYEFDAKKALEFEPKTAGIIFNIYDKDKFIQHVVTDDNGEIGSFLGSGDYRIQLVESSLPAHTYCEKITRDFTVQAGKIINLEPFVIKVSEKKIRVKKFGN